MDGAAPLLPCAFVASLLARSFVCVAGMNLRQIGSSIIFFTVVFWPVGVYVAFVSPALMRQLDRPVMALQAALFLVVPIVVIVLSYFPFSSQKEWKRRGWVIYGSWFLVGFLMAYAFSAALGGVSMAVVEGVASPTGYLQNAGAAVLLLGMAHIAIVPWVFIALFTLKAINRRFHLWSDVVAN